MGMLEDIRPLTPVPSSPSIGHQRPHRIQHEEKPSARARAGNRRTTRKTRIPTRTILMNMHSQPVTRRNDSNARGTFFHDDVIA